MYQTQIEYNNAKNSQAFSQARAAQKPLTLKEEEECITFLNRVLNSVWSQPNGTTEAREYFSNGVKKLQKLFYHYENLNHYYTYTGGLNVPGLGNEKSKETSVENALFQSEPVPKIEEFTHDEESISKSNRVVVEAEKIPAFLVKSVSIIDRTLFLTLYEISKDTIEIQEHIDQLTIKTLDEFGTLVGERILGGLILKSITKNFDYGVNGNPNIHIHTLDFVYSYGIEFKVEENYGSN